MVEPLEFDIELSWECRSWKDCKVMTIDNKGRFATIEFFIDKKGKDQAKIVPLCDYPKKAVTNHFWVFPESDTVCVWSSKMMHIYNARTKKKNSFVPVLSWKGFFDKAFELSEKDLYMHFYYDSNEEDRHVYVTYDQNKKLINDEDFDEISSERLLFQTEPYSKNFIACNMDYKNDFGEYFYYNIDSKERRCDDFTRKLTELFQKSSYEMYINNNERYIISVLWLTKEDNNRIRRIRENVLMTWDEEKKKFKVFPFNYLAPSEKRIEEITYISEDLHWGLYRVKGYRGVNNESLFKYAFVKFDIKYPTKVSPLIIIDDYHRHDYWEYGTFFEHFVYGTCFVYSYTDGKGIKKTYLYKMSDIEKEIEAKLKDAANKLVK